ncbi:MAG: hypothetical protein AB1921_10770 [Thermodesulfobacteriota bacterium]
MRKRYFFLATVVLVALFLGTDALAFRDPFASVWDFDRPRLMGHPKNIVTKAQTYTKRETFNEKGQKVEEVLFTPTGSLGMRYLFVYDTDGNLVGLDIYQEDNKIPVHERAQYSAKGVIHAIEGFYVPQRALVIYNDKGFISQIVGVDERGERSYVWKYTWTEDGDLAELQLFGANGEALGKREMTYNDQHFQKTQVNYDARGNLHSRMFSEYKYDKQGNWVEKQVDREMPVGNHVQKDKAELTRKIEYWQ